MTGIPFWKWESIANDFPLFHASDLVGITDIPQFVVRVSDRRYGVGGDGVLILGKEEADLRLAGDEGVFPRAGVLRQVRDHQQVRRAQDMRADRLVEGRLARGEAGFGFASSGWGCSRGVRQFFAGADATERLVGIKAFSIPDFGEAQFLMVPSL